MSARQDHEPDAFDEELVQAEVHVGSRNPDIELTISVPVATATLRALTERAHLQGRNVESLIADALQGAA